MVYKNANIFLNGKFSKGEFTARDSINNAGCEDEVYVIPRLVDIHSHGCAGYDFSYASPEELGKMAEYYYANGIGTVLATTMTESRKTIMQAADNIRKYSAGSADVTASDGNEGNDSAKALIAGIYMEGPFFGEERKGAHDPAYLTDVDLSFLDEFNKASGDRVKVVAFDPCRKGAEELVECYNDKFVLSIAHTPCDYVQADRLMKKGVKHVTHLFNAMEGLDKRNPGIPGAVLDNEDCYAEIICDGIHIHPAVIRSMFKIHGSHMVLISDSMSATGLKEGEYILGGQTVVVRDGKATLKDGTIAGSVCNLFEMFRRAVSFGVPLEQAVAAVTVNPAKSAGLSEVCGFITDDSYLVLDKELNIIG